MWLKVMPHFLCKEMRQKEQAKVDQLQQQKDFVEREKMLLALRGQVLMVKKMSMLIGEKRNTVWYAWIAESEDDTFFLVDTLINGSYSSSKKSRLDAEFKTIMQCKKFKA
jgi:hypothetical protein